MITNERAKANYPRIGLFIDGRWEYERPACAEVLNPSDDQVLATVPKATTEDISAALESSRRGFAVWRDLAPEARSRILLRAANLLRERADRIGTIISLELGKPFADARAEVERTCGLLEWDAGEGMRLYGRIIPSAPGSQNFVLRQPIGPVAAFTPWNAPVGSPTRKVSGALAAGCSVILKAAEETPGAACEFVQCFADAGLPAGVLNLVFGNPSEISRQLIDSPTIRMVTFTGSIPIGKHLTQLAAAQMKPVLMELGGHAPVIVCEDVDASAVGRLAAAAKVRMAGQICISPTRFLVVGKAYEAFVAALGESVSGIRVGDAFAADTQMGPVANARRLTAVTQLVDDAVSDGARLVTGGKRIGTKGCFYAPTVLADVPLEVRAMKEEPFGPLALCTRVRDLDEALQIANSLSVGLAGYAFTNSLANAEKIARLLECGTLSINHFGGPAANMPFGGVKESGIGREGGLESLDSYTITRNVSQKASLS